METGRRQRLLEAAPYFAALFLAGLKVPYLLSMQPLTGWDTIGHLHLASVYRGLFSGLRSAGYDPGWFQGQPAFLLYPPFFYFVVALLDSLSGHLLPLPASFNFAILLVVLFYCCAYLSLARAFLADSDPMTRALLAAAGLLVPLGYSGDGLQGAGLVGVLEGTFVSTLGLALALMALAALERYRLERRPASLARCVCLAALLFYTHYLATIFYCVLVAIYLLSFRREMSAGVVLTLVLGPAALGAPIVSLFLQYAPFSSATAQVDYYPPLLSLLGKDFYAAWRVAPTLETLVDQLLARLQIARVLPLALAAAGVWLVLRGRMRAPQARFVCAATLAFLWLATDSSLAFLLPGLPVHWYRAFDFFLTFLGLLAILAVGPVSLRLGPRLRTWVPPAGLLALMALRLVVWDPVAHEEQPTMSLKQSLASDPDAARLASYLRSLPTGSMVLPEVLRTRATHGSPHWLDYLIQSAGLRNSLGLTIESSLTPLVTYAYMSQGMGHTFVWGIDPSWADALFGGLGPAAQQRLAALPDYLAASGVEYFVVQSERARAYLESLPRRFRRTFASGPLAVYAVAGALPPITALAAGHRPWGLVDLAALQGRRVPARRVYRDFLLHANWVRIYAGVDPIINLTPRVDAIEGLAGSLAGLVIVNTARTPAAYHALPAVARSGVPLILVNFVPDPSLPAGVEVLLPPSQGGPALVPRAQAPAEPGAAATVPRQALAGVSISGSDVRARLEAPAPGTSAASEIAQGGQRPVTRAVEVRLSYSPLWRSADGAPVFQTGLDHMLVLAAATGASSALHLQLAAPLARVVTLAMTLLVIAAAAAGPVERFLFRARSGGADALKADGGS